MARTHIMDIFQVRAAFLHGLALLSDKVSAATTTLKADKVVSFVRNAGIAEGIFSI